MTFTPATGEWKNGEFSFPIRIYYEDTDVGGMTYHARYVSFFERIRSESVRGSTADVHMLLSIKEEDGGPVVYVVRNINVTYHRQSTVDDMLTGFCFIKRVRGAAVVISQRIENSDGELVAEAEVLVAVVDTKGRPRRWPAATKETWVQWCTDYENANGEDAA